MADEEKDVGALVERIQATTCTGDVRDFLLDRLKHDKNPLPWNMRSEDEQRDSIERATSAARALVEKVVRLVAADGFQTLHATLQQFTAKDGIKVVLEMAATDENVLALNHRRGASIMMVIADDAAYTGEKAAVPITPNEPELPMAEAAE